MKSKFTWMALVVGSLVIKVFSFFPAAVERYYAHGLFPYIAAVQRFLLGWIPFSVGDIIYFIVFLLLVQKLFRLCSAVFSGRATMQRLVQWTKQVIFVCLVIYVSFNVLWGLNYNRLPLDRQMGLPMQTYSTQNLSVISGILIRKLNGFDASARAHRSELSTKKTLFKEAVETYRSVAGRFPALQYRHASLKPSLYSYAGNYLGFTGYYNPFSGEAQANTTVPYFMQPFTTCHEIGHQLGYAKENEANFAGFLAARSSPNLAFQYSVYFDMYTYAIRELFYRDSTGAKELNRKLSLQVKLDRIQIRQFYQKYENPLGPLISTLYSHYLKANEQPEGLRSYSEVVASLLAFYKKYGEI